ncbi:MAG: SDR family NAD(P)-dependent oxidoreductase [Calditrichia bacterium]
MSDTSKKILVTGAGGFIGFNLANYLADSGHQVAGVDLHYPEHPFDGKDPRFETVRSDFRNWSLMKDLLKDKDVVFHLASAHLQISLDESEYWDINVHSLRPLLELSRKGGVKRFIHVSSVGVYGNLKTWPADEESECHPQSIYGETKIAGEEEVRKFYRETGFPVVIVRPAWVYGPGCPRTLKIYRTLKKKRFIMIGKGENLRHPIFIADMLEAFRITMDHEKAVGETFIIAGEKAITTTELVEGFSSSLDIPGPLLRIPYFLGKTMAVTAELLFGIIKKEPPLSRRSLEFFDTNNAFDISKAKKLLNFVPQYSFEKGLVESRGWLENN